NQGDNDPNEWNTTLINLAQYAAGAATNWVVPHSEIVTIGGTQWSWVADLTGFTASDQVYTIDYDAATNGPRSALPAASVDAATTWEVVYCYTVNSGSLTAAFGIGDVDSGCSDAASSSASTVEIVETTLTPATDWQDLRSIFTIVDVAAASADEVWVVDAADNSAGGDEFVQVFSITQAGAEAHVEAGDYYDDLLSGPRDVYVADIGSGYTIASCPTPASFSAVTILDANQVTGHAYRIRILGTQAGDPVTVTDNTTGRVLLSAANWTDLPSSAATTYVMPGVGMTRDSDNTPSADTDEVIQTVRTVYRRFAFVTDTGNDRIKVIAYDNFARTGDVLPGDARACVVQPAAGGGAGTVAQPADQDYFVTVPATVPENWTTATATRPIKEGTISITEDPAGAPIAWTRINDLATAGPTDRVYTLDWQEGYIIFGDGVNGRMPTAA
ncbi:MAG: hypothetical protein GY778_09135, partial [bacterium]|nr:hypothetical protein [bacterium]